ncbi:hypothetical protein M3Y94_00412200 [Aphelenchoides besseyi]|nr:hypothetical protein M3Y94_00412200 [Aphelenchoides besseyi]
MVDTTEETERTSPLVKIRDQRYRMPSKLKGLNVQFENPIGEGAFGQVYRGRWNGTAVVVKRCKLRNKESIDPRAEAKILEKLNNKAKNVVKFYGCYEDGEYCYMVMEYCKEGSIYDYVKREGIMREKWVRKVAIDVNEALRQIHSNGILHRDVSPKNVLIWEFNENNLPEVKLIDFGLSKEMVKARGTTCGTPGFMVNGKNEGTNRDYYALGCLVIYMLTKRIFDDERKRRDYVKNRIHGEITSENAIEFIRLLINPKIELDYQDIVTHPFLSEPLIERLSQRSSRILTSQNREHSRTTSREPRQPSRPPSIQRDKPKSIERRSNSDLRNNLQNVPVLPEELLKKEHSKTTERKRSLSRQPSKRQAFSVPTNCPRTNSALTIDSHHPHADIEWPLKNAVMDINKNIKNKGRIIFNSQGKYVAFEFASNLNLECVVRIERVGQGNQKVEVYDPKSRSSVRLKDYANEVPKSDLKLRITIRSSQELAKAARDFGDMVVSEWVVHKTANQKYVVTEKRTGLKKKFESREDLYRAELF